MTFSILINSPWNAWKTAWLLAVRLLDFVQAASQKKTIGDTTEKSSRRSATGAHTCRLSSARALDLTTPFSRHRPEKSAYNNKMTDANLYCK
ncbi:MAG: hypothetical protein EKK29_22575 [Hyphomicrobiales bacterium]|nr:MAG: hypothetical protein EKK29_22575 [Hyphomicrobiales bacterium]